MRRGFELEQHASERLQFRNTIGVFDYQNTNKRDRILTNILLKSLLLLKKSNQPKENFYLRSYFIFYIFEFFSLKKRF